MKKKSQKHEEYLVVAEVSSNRNFRDKYRIMKKCNNYDDARRHSNELNSKYAFDNGDDYVMFTFYSPAGYKDELAKNKQRRKEYNKYIEKQGKDFAKRFKVPKKHKLFW